MITITEDNYVELIQTPPFSKTVAVDLDGVLNKYDGVWKGYEEDYESVSGAINFLESLHELGYRVCIMTARRDLQSTIAWLERHKLSDLVDLVTNWKIPCFAYIDDRAICHKGNLDVTLEALENFSPHWDKGYDSLKKYD